MQTLTVKTAFEKGNEFASGTAINYEASSLIGKTGKIQSKQSVASNCLVGMRFKSHQVVRHAEGLALHIGDVMKSDLRYRILLFAGRARQDAQMKRVRAFAEYLDGAESVISRFTAKGEPRDALIEVITVHAEHRDEIEMADFPSALFPPHDYGKIYADCESYHRGHGQIYQNLGIDSEEGAVVVLRPDGCQCENPCMFTSARAAETDNVVFCSDTALVCDLEDTAMLDAYFSGVLVRPKQSLGPSPEDVKTWAQVKAPGDKAALAAEPLNNVMHDETGAM